MIDKREHHRDSEHDAYGHIRSDDISDSPAFVRWILYAIRSIGFPSVLVLILLGGGFLGLKKFSEIMMTLDGSMNRQSLSLEALIITINGNHAEGLEWRREMMVDIRELKARLK